MTTATVERTTAQAQAWRGSGHFVLRTTGFPFELLQSLAGDGGDSTLCSESAFEGEVRAARSRLREICRDDRFREAVLLSSEAALDRIDSLEAKPLVVWPPSAQARIERLAAAYLQRFCAKNEATSFFGPTAYGSVEKAIPGIDVDPSGQLAQRRVRLSNWAAMELCRTLGREAAAIPTNAWNPLKHMPTAVTEHPVLIEIQGLLSEMESAAVGARRGLVQRMTAVFESATKTSARRNGGATYADRGICWEECALTAGTLAMSEEVIAALTSGAPSVMDLATYPARLRLTVEREIWAGFFVEEWGGAAVAYERAATRIGADAALRNRFRGMATAEWTRRIEPWMQTLARTTSGKAAAEVGAEALAELQSAMAQEPAEKWPCFASPDILIDAPDLNAVRAGDFRIVLGEIHHTIGVGGVYASVSNRIPALREDLEDLIRTTCAPLQPVNFLLPAGNKTFAALDLGFADIEYGGRALPHKATLSIGDLVMTSSGDRPALVDRRSGAELFLYNKLPHVLGLYPLRLFSLPSCTLNELQYASLAHRGYQPRLNANGVTMLRAKWRVSTRRMLECFEQPSAWQAFRAIQQLREQQMWPRYVYAKSSAGEKPLFVDFDSALLLDVLRAHLRKSSSSSVEISEMLPGPDALWLRDVAGSHTCEFRMSFGRR